MCIVISTCGASYSIDKQGVSNVRTLKWAEVMGSILGKKWYEFLLCVKFRRLSHRCQGNQPVNPILRIGKELGGCCTKNLCYWQRVIVSHLGRYCLHRNAWIVNSIRLDFGISFLAAPPCLLLSTGTTVSGLARRTYTVELVLFLETWMTLTWGRKWWKSNTLHGCDICERVYELCAI
jgi:hypothetical protein